MVSMLNAAQEVSSESLTADLSVNDALKEGIFWADAKINGISASVHQYMGSILKILFTGTHKCRMNPLKIL